MFYSLIFAQSCDSLWRSWIFDDLEVLVLSRLWEAFLNGVHSCVLFLTCGTFSSNASESESGRLSRTFEGLIVKKPFGLSRTFLNSLQGGKDVKYSY